MNTFGWILLIVGMASLHHYLLQKLLVNTSFYKSKIKGIRDLIYMSGFILGLLLNFIVVLVVINSDWLESPGFIKELLPNEGELLFEDGKRIEYE
jgi:hypothetical protein